MRRAFPDLTVTQLRPLRVCQVVSALHINPDELPRTAPSSVSFNPLAAPLLMMVPHRLFCSGVLRTLLGLGHAHSFIRLTVSLQNV
jgi:hypothetical protein